MAFVLGGVTLDCPPLLENYRVEREIVAGREATALSGAPLSLGVIRKRVWTLTFYPGEGYEAIMAMLDTQVSFVDHDGSTYLVKVTGDGSVSGYPVSQVGKLTLTLREV